MEHQLSGLLFISFWGFFGTVSLFFRNGGKSENFEGNEMNLSSGFDCQTLRVNRWRQLVAHPQSLLDSKWFELVWLQSVSDAKKNYEAVMRKRFVVQVKSPCTNEESLKNFV